MVFVSTILAMLLFSAMGLSVVSMVSTNLSGTNDDQTATQAFHVAEGGMQYILMNQFVGDADFSNNASPTGAPFGGTPISLNPGQFWIQYSNQSASSIDIAVTGRVGSAVRIVRQTVGPGNGGYDYGVMSEGNIDINSSTGDIYGDLALKGNANIDEDVDVHGNIYEDDDLEVPAMDLQVYQDMCTTTHSGNLTISANTNANLCVTGNVTINAGVTYTGLLYSEGTITINGNNVIVNGSLVAEGNVNAQNNTGQRFTAAANMPAIVSDGNVSLDRADGMQITGLIWNDGNSDLSNSDNLVFTGAFMGGGNFIMNSAANLSITFDADLIVGIPGLAPGDGEALSLSGWKAF